MRTREQVHRSAIRTLHRDRAAGPLRQFERRRGEGLAGGGIEHPIEVVHRTQDRPAVRLREYDLGHLPLLFFKLLERDAERTKHLSQRRSESRSQRPRIACGNQNRQQCPRADREDEWFPVDPKQVRVPVTKQSRRSGCILDRLLTKPSEQLARASEKDHCSPKRQGPAARKRRA